MPEIRVHFTPNVPQELILLSEGEYLSEIEQVRYSVQGGKTLYLDSHVAGKLFRLEIACGERFFLCKRTRKGRYPMWDVWLSPESEKLRAEVQAPGAQWGKSMPRTGADYEVPISETVNSSPEGIDTGGIPPGSKQAAQYVAEQKLLALLREMPAEKRVAVLDGLPMEDRLRLSLLAALTETAASAATAEATPSGAPDLTTRIRMAAAAIQQEGAIPAKVTPISNGTSANGTPPVRTPTPADKQAAAEAEYAGRGHMSQADWETHVGRNRRGGGRPPVVFAVALCSILRDVRESLKAEKQEWSDVSKEKIVVAALIEAWKRELVTFNFHEERGQADAAD